MRQKQQQNSKKVFRFNSGQKIAKSRIFRVCVWFGTVTKIGAPKRQKKQQCSIKIFRFNTGNLRKNDCNIRALRLVVKKIFAGALAPGLRNLYAEDKNNSS
ncbi:hypothetical protein L0337_11380 [candidate division KSB1 bacterium]|nr:hypothetical protein [candidate division KSB1 bacterium]